MTGSRSQSALGQPVGPATYGHVNRYNDRDPITGEFMARAAPFVKELPSQYTDRIDFDTYGNCPRNTITGIPMISLQTYQRYRTTTAPPPYHGYYRSRNPSAHSQSATDIGYGRYKFKTGDCDDNVHHYSNQIYGTPNAYDTEFDIITGNRKKEMKELEQGSKTYHKGWARTEKRFPHLQQHFTKARATASLAGE